MRYPCPIAIEAAGVKQLSRWQEFLPEPGMNYYGQEDFYEMQVHEGNLMDLINKRLSELGGFVKEVTKVIGDLK
jgi:hypothetical protein